MLALLFSVLSSTADAAAPRADLAVTLSLPSATPDVYEAATYTAEIANNGRRHAQSVALTIQLPETNSSPDVYVLGEASSIDSRCAESGTTLTCSLGRIRAGRSATVSFDLALPWSADPLVIDAEVSTTTSETATADNTDAVTAALGYVDIVVSGPQDVTNQHCTGSGLAAYYTCTLFPSSISAHDATLEADGSIRFPSPYSSYGGAWGQDSGDHLWLEYTDGTSVVAEFEGNGVDASSGCFEGLTTFPGSAYVSPYQVCLQ